MPEPFTGRYFSYGPNYYWKCPRVGCKKEVSSWTEKGMQNFKEMHEEEHANEDRENRIAYQKALETAPPKNYNELLITHHDVNFLKTRGIAIDESMKIIGDEEIKNDNTQT
jgi:hypothetical protein